MRVGFLVLPTSYNDYRLGGEIVIFEDIEDPEALKGKGASEIVQRAWKESGKTGSAAIQQIFFPPDSTSKK